MQSDINFNCSFFVSPYISWASGHLIRDLQIWIQIHFFQIPMDPALAPLIQTFYNFFSTSSGRNGVLISSPAKVVLLQPSCPSQTLKAICSLKTCRVWETLTTCLWFSQASA